MLAWFLKAEVFALTIFLFILAGGTWFCENIAYLTVDDSIAIMSVCGLSFFAAIQFYILFAASLRR